MKKKANILFKVIDKNGKLIAYTKDSKHADLIIKLFPLEKKPKFKPPYTIEIVDEFTLEKVKHQRVKEFIENFEDYSDL